MHDIPTHGASADAGAATILALVDLHWSGSSALRLPDLAGVDLLLLGGDLTNFRGADVARELLGSVQAAGAAGPDVLAVCGNCDQPEVEGVLDECGIALDRRAVSWRGAKLLGLSGGLPFGGCPYERTEEEFAAACAELFGAADGIGASGPTILLSHQPPFGTRCDRTRGRHVGSRAVRAAIEEHQPDLVLCGHIHEAVGRDTIGRSVVMNPGPWFRGGAVRFSLAHGAICDLTLVQV